MADQREPSPQQPQPAANPGPPAAPRRPAVAPTAGTTPQAAKPQTSGPTSSGQQPPARPASPRVAPPSNNAAAPQIAKPQASGSATPGQQPPAKPFVPRVVRAANAAPQTPQPQASRPPAPPTKSAAPATPGAQVPAQPTAARPATTPPPPPAKTQPTAPAAAKAKPPAPVSSAPATNATPQRAAAVPPPTPNAAKAAPKPHAATGTTLDELFALNVAPTGSKLPIAELAVSASPLTMSPGAATVAPATSKRINWGRYVVIVLLIGVCTGTGLYLFDKYVVQPNEQVAKRNGLIRTPPKPLTPEEKAAQQAKAKQAQEKFAAEQAKRQEEAAKQREAQLAKRKTLEAQKSTMVKNVEPSIVLITVKDEAGNELGLGSGFLIDNKGRIATNYHVIDNAWSADATFSTGNKKKILGAILLDEDRDLAVLQLEPDAQPYKPLPLANIIPDRTEPVIAIGHPQGFRFTTSSGTVTALYRTDQLPEQYRAGMKAPEDNMWIQTNAAISGGNSGGPLLNLEGQVIGINTWIGKDRPDMRFATSIENLQDLLEKAPTQHIALEKTTGLTGKVTQLYATYANSLEWFERQLREARSRNELVDLIENKSPIPEHAPLLMPYITNHPKTPAQWLALRAYLTMAREFYFPESCDGDLTKVLEIATRDYPDPKRQMDLLFLLLSCRREPAQKYLDNLAKNKAAPELAAFANFCLAARIADRADGDIKKLDEAVAYLKRIVVDYPGVQVPRIGNLANIANARIHALTYLEVGRTAQEIEADDALGTEFKLSEYRGKAVVLFFWADWCPYCQKMYPLLRSLVTKYEKEPFVVLGVNCDQSSARLQSLEDRKVVTWRNWFNGRDGDITEDWQISGYPTVILLDGKGVVRQVKVSPDELEDQAVALISEITGKSAGKKELPAWLRALGKKKAETSEAPKEEQP